MRLPARVPPGALALLALAAAIAATAAVVDRAGGGRHATSTAVEMAAPARPRPGSPPRNRPPRHLHAPVTIEWVGDIALSTSLGLPPGGAGGALAPLARTLRSADVTLGNLEGTLSTGGSSKCAATSTDTCHAFQAPPATAFALRRAGFDLLNQANNHAQDFGPSGHAQTIAALRRAGLRATGDPGQIAYLTVRRTRIAVLGFAPYSSTANLLDLPAAASLVRRAARRASLVVVIIHAGAEGAGETHTPRGSESYLGEDRGDARAFAHAAIRAGASLVIGSGPHVIRGVERDRGRLIAYSLGNFVGYRTLAGGGVLDDSGILRVAVDPATGRLDGGRWIPVVLRDGLPRRPAGGGDIGLVAALSREDFPRSTLAIRRDGRFALAGQSSAGS